LFFPSAWCEEHHADPDQRDDLLPALARGYGLTVVNANWGVGPPRLPGMGSSRVVGPEGVELCRTSANGPRRLVVTIAGNKATPERADGA
jgi:predicted amidohydrolase